MLIIAYPTAIEAIFMLYPRNQASRNPPITDKLARTPVAINVNLGQYFNGISRIGDNKNN